MDLSGIIDQQIEAADSQGLAVTSIHLGGFYLKKIIEELSAHGVVASGIAEYKGIKIAEIDAPVFRVQYGLKEEYDNNN